MLAASDSATLQEAALLRLSSAAPVAALARWSLIGAAIASVAGIGFLVGMFAAFAVDATDTAMTLGWINDTLVIVQYVLVLPALVVVHLALRDTSPRASLVLAGLGGAGVALVVVSQGLLVLGVLTFEEQIGPALVGYIPLAAWFIATGVLLARSGLDPRGTAMGVVGASYLGFPVWAARLAGRLEALPIMESTPRTA